MTVGPGNEEASARGHGRMRASDGDREQAIDVLKAAFTHGRLTKDELNERVSHALVSRTYADLNALTSDIPHGLAAGQRPEHARAAIDVPAGAKLGPRDRAIIATAALAGLAFVVAFLLNDGVVSGLMSLGSVLTAFASLTLLLSQTRSARRAGRGQPGGTRALDSGQPEVPASDQLPWTEPRRQSATDVVATRRPRPQAIVLA